MGYVGALLVVVLLVLLGLAAVVTLLVLVFRAGARQRERRTTALAAYAAARGFSLRPDDQSLRDRFEGEPFGRGTGRVVSDVLEGTHGGRPVVAFGYRWSTGSGDHRHHHRVYVVATALPTAVPALTVVPSSALGSLVDALSGGDHRVGDPTFDAAYRVFTANPVFAADVLDPPMRAWLLPQRPPMFRLHRADLVVVAQGPMTPEAVDRALTFADALLERVPARVWDRAALGPA